MDFDEIYRKYSLLQTDKMITFMAKLEQEQGNRI